MVGPSPAFSPTPYGVAIGLQAAGDLRPRQARLFLEPLEPLREVVGEDVGSSAVVCALSWHGTSAPRAQPWVLSYAGAGIPFLYHSYRGRSGSRLERLTRPFILACFFLSPLLAWPIDGEFQPKSGLPSLPQMACSAAVRRKLAADDRALSQRPKPAIPSLGVHRVEPKPCTAYA